MNDEGSKQPGRGGRVLRERVRNQRERIDRLRRQIEKKDREIEALRSRVADAPLDASGPPAQGMPVFLLVGQAKSGTSWLMRTLNAHPEVLCKGEGRFFGRDYIREDVLRAESRIQPSSLYRAILDAEYLGSWVERSVWSRDEDKDEHLNNLTRLAIDYFLGRRLSKSGKKIVGDKTPFLNETILEEVSGIYPEARVIHIIRDGRDIAVSAMHHIWNREKEHAGHLALEPEERAKRDAYRKAPENLLETGEGLFAASRLRHFAESWSSQVGRARRDGPRLLGDNYVEVRYEDLLECPEEEVGRLLRFLGADAGEETVGRCVENASFERWAGGRRPGEEDPAAFLRKGVAGDWKNVFTEEDKCLFKEAAGDALVELGYEKDHDW